MQSTCHEATLTGRNKVFSVSLDTQLPALQLQYVGNLTYAKFKVVTTVLTLYADDTNGTTTAVLTADTNAAGYDTFGELVDAINATGVFRAFLIGANRSDDADAMLDVIAATSCKTTNGVTLFFEQDTSAQIFGFGITNQKFLYRPTLGWATHKKGWTRDINCINSLKMLSAVITITAHANVRIYQADDENKVNGVLLWSQDLASTVEELHGDTVPEDIFISGSRGFRLLVQFVALTAGDDFTGAVIKCIGHTKDVAGGQVPDSNYTGSV